MEKYVSEKVKVIFLPKRKVKLKNYWFITYAMRSSKITKEQAPEVFCKNGVLKIFTMCTQKNNCLGVSFK